MFRYGSASWLRSPTSRSGSANIRNGSRSSGAASTPATTRRILPNQCGSSAEYSLSPRRLLVAVFQILVRDRKHGVGLDVDVANKAVLRAAIADLGVVAARLHAGDAQPLVVVDLLVLVIQGLVGTPIVLSGRRKLKFRDGRGGQIPQSDAFSLRGRFIGAHRQQCRQSQYPSHRAVLSLWSASGRYCLIRRSRFFILSKFFARSRPIGAINRAVSRS